MIITLKKFGTTLVSRQAGREALSAFTPTLRDISETESVVIDFEGVITFSPSWCDEFITPLLERFGIRLSLQNTQNVSVQATLEMLKSIDARYAAIQL